MTGLTGVCGLDFDGGRVTVGVIPVGVRGVGRVDLEGVRVVIGVMVVGVRGVCRAVVGLEELLSVARAVCCRPTRRRMLLILSRHQ